MHRRMTLIHLTKPTAPRANRSHQQKRCGLLAVALASVWTAAFFANRVNIALFDNLLDIGNLAGFPDRGSP